ncbi:MAG: GNAT family N-acetyltransferase, partial [Sphingobacteriales bacterium]
MLRKALQQDLEFVYELYMHPAVNPYLLYEPMDLKEFMPIYNELLEKDLKYIYITDATPAGMVKIIPNIYRAAHVAYIGGLAI